MINKKIKQYEIVGDFKHIQILEEIYNIEDNIVVSHEPNHRRVIAPGDDYSSESDEIKSICALLHTDEIVNSFKAQQAAQ